MLRRGFPGADQGFPDSVEPGECISGPLNRGKRGMNPAPEKRYDPLAIRLPLPVLKATLVFSALLLLLPPLVTSAAAVDSLVVGLNSRQGGWNTLRDASRFMGVDADSIWMWGVEPDANLSLTMDQRNGRVLRLVPGMFGPSPVEISGAEVLSDGDPLTYYDADLISQQARRPGLGRTTAIHLDLGATFRVNRIRFFPRLDPRNQRRFLQEFSVATHPSGVLGDFEELLSFYPALPNFQPVVEKRFESRDVRFVRIAPTSQRPWEIAEFEVFGDGSLPTGEFRSKPMGMGLKVFGLVRFEGRGVDSSPVLIHTRVGPDKEAEWYFLLEEEGDEIYRAKDRAEYMGAKPHLRGPIRPNPNWSSWEPVSQGVVRSRNLERYMQFRVRLFTPGVRLDRLVFETIFPPLIQRLVAEVSPDTVAAGVETEFSLAMLAHMKISTSRGTRTARSDTGFERILIETDAHIRRIQQVRIDDRRVAFTSRRHPGGMYINLRRQVEQDGSFVQVRFLGTVYRDKTAFRIRVLDDRVNEKRTSEGTVEIKETGYHFAVPGDADAETSAQGLVVTLEKQGARAPLLANFELENPVLTPNGDGINDELRIGYSLLTVTRPSPVELSLFDLGGRPVASVEAMQPVGNHSQVWDGRGSDGALVPPGTYIYRLRVRGDGDPEVRRGIVAVVY